MILLNFFKFNYLEISEHEDKQQDEINVPEKSEERKKGFSKTGNHFSL